LKESEEKYRSYIDNAPDGVFVTDEKGNYLEVNDAASRITGYSKDELLSMNIADFIAEEGKEAGMQHFQTLQQTGFSSGELIFTHKDGTKRWWNVNAVKLSDTRLLGFAKDITEKKIADIELKKSKKESDSILNTAADGIRIITKDFKVKAMNNTMSKMTNIPKETGIGMRCSDMFKSKDCGTENCSMLKVLETGEGFEREEIMLSPDGTEIPCTYSVVPYKDEMDNIIGVIEDFRDITELKEAEKEIIKLNTELKEKVIKRTQEVEHLLKQKDEFIYQLGHDLKNPLTTFTTLIPLLEKKTEDSKSKEMLDIIHRNSKYMTSLIIKTLELARLNSPNTTFDIGNTNLLECLNNVILNYNQTFEENNIQVENKIQAELVVKADKLRLEELFTNLIMNAVKYNNENGKIVINAKPKNDEIVVSVVDNGIGLNNDQINNIFKEYYKVDESRSKIESHGLGLSICKKIVEKHGGRIWAESEGEGKGSVFNFTLKQGGI